MWVRKIPLKIPLTDHSMVQKGLRVAASDIITRVGLEKQRGNKEPEFRQKWQKPWSVIRILALETMYLMENRAFSNASFPNQGMLLPRVQHNSLYIHLGWLQCPPEMLYWLGQGATKCIPHWNEASAKHCNGLTQCIRLASDNLNKPFLAPVSQNSCPSLNWWIWFSVTGKAEVGMV